MLANFIDDLLSSPVSLVAFVLSLAVAGYGATYAVTSPRLFLLGLKNLRRNLLRTLLTTLATIVLVFMVSLIWTVISGLDKVTQEKSKDFKLIITERWQLPSQLPMTHANYLDPANSGFLTELRDDAGKPLYTERDFMTWSFYGGTLDPAKRDPKNLVFFFAMQPQHIIPMMDELEDFDPALVEKMKAKPDGALLGRDKLEAIGNKRVGDRFKLTSINYKDIDLEFEVVGMLPDGRYNQSAIMNSDYFNRELDAYRRKKGYAHPLDTKRLNLIWLRVPDRETFNRVGAIIENASAFADRPVKVETSSNGIGSFLEPYKDLLWGMKWLLVPAILIIMSLVMANAISIAVRERRMEMAVMKVLGFRPNQILQLVLGEALLVGAVAGLIAAALTYGLFNGMWGGIPFRIGFFPVFRIPESVFCWGIAMGGLTAFLGSAIPAWNARSVKVSEVFSKVA